MEWVQTSPANRFDNAAMPARSQHGVPTRPASGKGLQDAFLVQGLPRPWLASRIGIALRELANCSALIQQPMSDRRVAVNPAVAQKWPIPACIFYFLQVHLTDDNFFFILGCLGDHRSKRIAQE